MMWDATYQKYDQKDYHIWNGDYADAFEEPLFLHRDRPAVCLRNLFVLQKYRNLKNGYEPRTELWTRLGAFVEDESKELLILEGDAGCGKTSLVQALCWHKRARDEIGSRVLGDRPLVTVRLRELDKERITAKEGLLPALLDALGAPAGEKRRRKQWLLERFPRAVLVLDGSDELCIIEGIGNYEDLLYRLTAERLADWRFVVTSRPGYIRHDIDISTDMLELLHFDEEKRGEWIKRYTDPKGCACGLPEELADYIRKGEEEGVCDTPLTLYLLAAGEVGPEERENLWKLYHRLFAERLTKRLHDEEAHPGVEYGTAPYRLAEEMAWRMYRGKNERLYLQYEELASIADRLWEKDPEFRRGFREEDTARSLAERNVGLCCYLKSSEDRGAVEFYHNNIRDFFLAEKLWRELLRVYEDPAPREEKIQKLTVFFRDALRTRLEPRVIEFLYLRAKAERTGRGLPAREKDHDLCPDLLQLLLGDGRVYDGLKEKRLLPTITAILANVVRCDWALREPLRREGERHRWWRNVEEINDAGLLCAVFGNIFRAFGSAGKLYAPGAFGDFRDVGLGFTNLYYLSLRGADLRGADLREADLRGAYLSEANLSRADLFGANLRGAYLFGANLCEADLRGATLRGANLRGANLREADLREADLSGADLRRADLCGADLREADLCGAYLLGADLRGAVLPDAFHSWDNDEQREHLRSLKIPGLQL
jgi:uncharacterized protein YjbI with pentapeptide repeats